MHLCKLEKKKNLDLFLDPIPYLLRSNQATRHKYRTNSCPEISFTDLLKFNKILHYSTDSPH